MYSLTRSTWISDKYGFSLSMFSTSMVCAKDTKPTIIVYLKFELK